MKLYIVTADTYIEDPYGSSIKFFGVFSEIEKANKIKSILNEEYQAEVSEVSLDEACELYLGGYIE